MEEAGGVGAVELRCAGGESLWPVAGVLNLAAPFFQAKFHFEGAKDANSVNLQHSREVVKCDERFVELRLGGLDGVQGGPRPPLPRSPLHGTGSSERTGGPFDG